MKLLTFLGATRYFKTTYLWQGREHTCNFSPIASCHFFQPDSITVFLTSEARERAFDVFRQELPENFPIKTVHIPIGKNETELWQIFSAISEHVEAESEVIFDVTHGLRSFPMLGILAAVYLRSGLRVKLRSVLYGAFEVRDKTIEPNRAPIFDLGSMLVLLDWSAAANRFNRTGDARYLASLVKDQQKELAQAAKGNHEALSRAGDLSNLAGALTSISQSLRLIRVHQAMEQIAGLPSLVEKAQPALEKKAAALPFSLLLDDIAKSYAPLSHPNPLDPKAMCQTLEIEREMIGWYLAREHWAQAVSLAREWMVSWIMLQLNLPKLTNLKSRHETESMIGREAYQFKVKKRAGRPFESKALAMIDDLEKVLSLWLALANIRNDIDHAGMRDHPKTSKNLVKEINKHLTSLAAFDISTNITNI